mmetsp:Transcript_26513/g.61428  ORF Transcript_26513/g.61428 Transcript_26513/m.61428 type:complete len:265 (-) Transcript_26513:525-1319(-)
MGKAEASPCKASLILFLMVEISAYTRRDTRAVLTNCPTKTAMAMLVSCSARVWCFSKNARSCVVVFMIVLKMTTTATAASWRPSSTKKSLACAVHMAVPSAIFMVAESPKLCHQRRLPESCSALHVHMAHSPPAVPPRPEKPVSTSAFHCPSVTVAFDLHPVLMALGSDTPSEGSASDNRRQSAPLRIEVLRGDAAVSRCRGVTGSSTARSTPHASATVHEEAPPEHPCAVTVVHATPSLQFWMVMASVHCVPVTLSDSLYVLP